MVNSSHSWKRKGNGASIAFDFPATLETEAAAAALNRKPQTLRKWACLEEGPIRPIRINGRLHWKVSDIQDLLSGNQVNNAAA